MKNPSHPGDILKRRVLPAAGLTVTAAARRLQVTRQALNRLRTVSRKREVSTETEVPTAPPGAARPAVREWASSQDSVRVFP